MTGAATARGRATPRERLTDLGYAAGWATVRAVPERWAVAAFDVGARRAARGGGPPQLRRNLARVLGVTPGAVPDALVAASLRSYARYWREAFRLPSMDVATLGRRVRVRHVERLDEALAAGRGAVLALPHSGNWDMAGVWLVGRHGTFTTVAERLRPESLFRRFVAYRESLGFEVIALSGGQRPPLELLRERLAAGGVVCLMAERDLTRHGVAVDFFGERTRMPAGPAKLAVDTGAALLPVHCWNDGDDGWGIHFDARLEPSGDATAGEQVAALTQRLADRFAVNIAQTPADWHMLQPQWLADLPPERRARVDGGTP